MGVLGLMAAAVAAAGVGLWVGMPGDPADPVPGTRLKGDGLKLEVFVDGTPPRQLASGDEVVPGDRLGFRVQSTADGHLYVLGRDETGAVYPCLPARPGPPMALAASAEPVDVHAAVVLDAVLGTEQLVAVRCDAPVAWSAAADAVGRWAQGEAATLDGCVHDTVHLDKVRARRRP